MSVVVERLGTFPFSHVLMLTAVLIDSRLVDRALTRAPSAREEHGCVCGCVCVCVHVKMRIEDVKENRVGVQKHLHNVYI